MKTLLMWILCPRYFADMPKDEPGTWVACSISIHYFGHREEREIREVEGLRAAYKTARWLALKLDWKLSPSWGVDWAIRKF